MSEINPDEIAQRIPVYVNRESQNRISLFKFPLRFKSRSYSSDKEALETKSIEVKDKSKQVQITFKILPDSVHFNHQNSHPNEELILSSRRIQDKSNYALCNIFNGRLILTPLEGTYQMLPNFSHIDEESTKTVSKKEKTATIRDNDIESITSVIQKMRKVEKEGSVTISKNYAEHMSFIRAEDWINLRQTKTDFRESFQRKTFSKANLKNGMTKETFLDFLKEKKLRFNLKGNSMKLVDPQMYRTVIRGLSNKYIRNSLKTYDEKILAILKNCNNVKFEEVRKILGLGGIKTDKNEWSKVNTSLSHFAVFLHGVWIAKSECVLEERERFARDYLLTLFWRSEDGKVFRRDWNSVADLTNESGSGILKGLAKFDEKNKIWDLRKKNDFRDFELFSKDKIANQNKVLERLSFISYRILTNGNQNPCRILEEHIKQSTRQTEIFIEETFNKYKICKMKFLIKILNKKIRDFGTISCLSFTPIDGFKTAIKRQCHHFPGDIYIRNTRENSKIDEFRYGVVNCLLENKSQTKEQISSYLRGKLQKDPPSSLHKIISDFCIVSGPKTFSLKFGDYS